MLNLNLAKYIYIYISLFKLVVSNFMEHYDAIKEASEDKVDTAVGLILNTSVVSEYIYVKMICILFYYLFIIINYGFLDKSKSHFWSHRFLYLLDGSHQNR